MANTNYCSEGDIIIWQTDDEDITNTAIQVNSYDSGVNLVQDGHVVSISFDTFDQLFKVMREFKKGKK